MGREHYFFSLGVPVKGYTMGPILGFFPVFSLISPEGTAKLRWAGPLAFMKFFG
jgi:hypothetical protein